MNLILKNSNWLSDNEFAFVALFCLVDGLTDMYKTVNTFSDSEKYKFFNKYLI